MMLDGVTGVLRWRSEGEGLLFRSVIGWNLRQASFHTSLSAGKFPCAFFLLNKSTEVKSQMGFAGEVKCTTSMRIKFSFLLFVSVCGK